MEFVNVPRIHLRDRVDDFSPDYEIFLLGSFGAIDEQQRDFRCDQSTLGAPRSEELLLFVTCNDQEAAALGASSLAQSNSILIRIARQDFRIANAKQFKRKVYTDRADHPL